MPLPPKTHMGHWAYIEIIHALSESDLEYILLLQEGQAYMDQTYAHALF